MAVQAHPPQPYPTLAKVDIASFDTFPTTTGGGCGVGRLPEVDSIVGHFNKIVGGLVEHSREGARLLGDIVDNPHQPLTPILATIPEGFDGFVARVVTRGMSPATMSFLGEDIVREGSGFAIVQKVMMPIRGRDMGGEGARRDSVRDLPGVRGSTQAWGMANRPRVKECSLHYSSPRVVI